MATSRLVRTSFWRDNYVSELDPIEKLLFLYFLTSPDSTIAGVYEINVRRVAFETGIDKDMIEKILTRFMVDGKVYYQDGWLVLKNFIKHQVLNPKIRVGIDKEIAKLPVWLQNIVQIKEEDGQLSLFVEVGDSLSIGYTEPIPFNIIKSNIIKSNIIKSNAPADSSAKASRISSESIDDIFDYWKNKVGYAVTSQAKSNRQYASKLLKEYPEDDVKRMIDGVAMATSDKYAPRIANFIQLYRKWDDLKLWGRRSISTQQSNRGVVL